MFAQFADARKPSGFLSLIALLLHLSVFPDLLDGAPVGAQPAVQLGQAADQVGAIIRHHLRDQLFRAIRALGITPAHGDDEQFRQILDLLRIAQPE